MADAQHFMAELMGRYKNTRGPIPSIALNDPCTMTCIANDFEYAWIFSRQIAAIGKPGDVLFAFTTSGNSVNVIEAIRQADEMGISVVTFTSVKAVSDLPGMVIRVPSFNTGIIQQAHTMMMHIICELLGI